jgi:hypothetical protein
MTSIAQTMRAAIADRLPLSHGAFTPLEIARIAPTAVRETAGSSIGRPL